MPVRRSSSASSAEICLCSTMGTINNSAAEFAIIRISIAAIRVFAAEIATTESAAKDSKAIGEVAGKVVAPSNEPSSTLEPSTSIDTLNQGRARTRSAKSCGAKAIAMALDLFTDHSHPVRSGYSNHGCLCLVYRFVKLRIWV